MPLGISKCVAAADEAAFEPQQVQALQIEANAL
jgi:hypothetical protein